MGLFDFFKKIDWEKVKQSKDVYPQNSISVVMTKTENEKPATGWVDLACKDYEFKKFCPHNLQFSIEIDDNNSSHLDMGTIEDYFINELKKECIVHPVSRIVTDFGFIMDLYIDNVDLAEKTLKELYENPNKITEFGCGFNYDPKWREYLRITKLIK